MKVYDSYEDAVEDSHTYEDAGVIEVVSSKTQARRKSLVVAGEKTVDKRQTVQNMFVLSFVWQGRQLDVLEIGGACGATYFELSHLLPKSIESWHVVETAGMAAAGRKLFQNNRLFFYDKLDTAVSKVYPELLIAQGVLQYLRDPLQALETWLGYGFPYVYVTRTLVGLDIEHSIITKQVCKLSEHGPGSVPKRSVERGTSQPLTIVPLESVTSCMSVGYDVLFTFIEREDHSLLLGSQTVRTRMVGFLLKKVL
jgi:putative methyltransferase (TIGR04325 family)